MNYILFSNIVWYTDIIKIYVYKRIIYDIYIKKTIIIIIITKNKNFKTDQKIKIKFRWRESDYANVEC